ncbi:Receptor-type protein tyrosine kinase [Rhodotorula toruloides ATCC 204091]|uniref:BY PROTMAP: gi/342320835/gb/EGU12773.1/ Receptor-type protein tyrosine kinase [Rhodotorula glutinis ATCC 204091] n=2 Tax=Rhodotorula toruloides TaxID=5286 RepID=A0A0K3CDH2_RHOTO|nr:Receptor-type protein tyrosine kinase [Rhodotorula toruloides ATCC 204091]
MASSSQGHAAFDPVRTAAADNEREKERRVVATHAALEAWGGLDAIRRMIIVAVNDWQENVCNFRRGRSDYITVFHDYAHKMPETLHVEPGLNTSEDRIKLTLPALAAKVVLDRDRAHDRQWAIALLGINISPDSVHELAVPCLLRAQRGNAPCAFAPMLNRRRIMDHGLNVGMTSESGRRDIQMYFWQHDVHNYQVSGVSKGDSHVSNPPRKVDFDLTVHLTSSNARPTVHLRITFDLDYGQPRHAGGATSPTATGNEVVARSLGERPPRVLRR